MSQGRVPEDQTMTTVTACYAPLAGSSAGTSLCGTAPRAGRGACSPAGVVGY